VPIFGAKTGVFKKKATPKKLAKRAALRLAFIALCSPAYYEG
jgi:hypothetical protein